MERESNSHQTQCKSGCGFYGNPATDGLCSLCYKEVVKKKQSTLNAAANVSTLTTVASMSNQSSNTPNFNNISSTNSTTSTSTNTLTFTTSANFINATPVTPKSTLSCSISSNTTTNNSIEDKEKDTSIGSELSSTETSSETPEDTPKKKNRCLICNKKLGLTGFLCRCGGLYCGIHRYSDKHDCTFNYRELGAQEIRKNNPVVVGEKIKKI